MESSPKNDFEVTTKKKKKNAGNALFFSRCYSSNWFIVVLTLTHRYNAVRGLRTGSNNSGVQDYLRRKTDKKQEL